MTEMSLTDGTNDGVGEELGEDLRLTILIGAQMAERVTHRIAEQRRQEEQIAQRQEDQARAELEAHRALARSATNGVDQDRWWRDAAPTQVARAWAMARAWAEHDAELAERAEVLREGLADRYGVTDPDRLDVRDLVEAQRDHRAAQVAGPVEEAEWEAREYSRYAEELRERRQEAENTPPTGRPGESLDREARLAGLRDLEQRAEGLSVDAQERAGRLRAQVAEPATGTDWDKAYDTAERRTALREQLRDAKVEPDAADARVLSDTAQGRPAREAARAPHRQPKARRGRRQGAQRQMEHGR